MNSTLKTYNLVSLFTLKNIHLLGLELKQLSCKRLTQSETLVKYNNLEEKIMELVLEK